MLKKLMTRTGLIAVLAAVFLLGSLSVGTVFAQSSDNSSPEQVAVQDVDDDAVEAEVEEADLDDVEEEVEEENEDEDDIDDADNVDNQVEQDGEFEGEF